MKNPVTTISGVILLVLSALTMFNVITQDQSASIAEYSGMLITAIVGLINLFKPGDKNAGV